MNKQDSKNTFLKNFDFMVKSLVPAEGSSQGHYCHFYYCMHNSCLEMSREYLTLQGLRCFS